MASCQTTALADYEQGPEEAWKRIWALDLKYGLGKKFVYTDVGFLVLGEIVHRVSGKNVAEFACREHLPATRNDMTHAILPPQRVSFIEFHPQKKETESGCEEKVHDPRAALLGGVAGHAGLFSTANDLALYANMMLSRGTVDGVRILGPQTIAEMTRGRDIAGQRRGLGWDMRSKYSSNRSELFSPAAFGHGGFTGTALWIDPEFNLFVIFLSSRLHPDGVGSVNHLAGRIGTVAVAAIQSRPSQREESTPVQLGIDVLERSEFSQLEECKVGLITNHTGLNRDEVRTIDLLHAAPQVELVSIFSPEHGLQGKLDVSQIADAIDPVTKLPIYSLYGETRKPLPEQLQGIDTLVFDIQDIGTRFYTYISTMGHAMEAAAEQGLRFVVLDRPNPIGGTQVEGPILDPGQESFVGFHTLPIRHGMTIGELAKMFQTERNWKLDLDVIRCENWRRSEYWDQSGLLWTNPSPNMRNLTQAALYPGIGILETTNLSVGRGTDSPFEIFGAPWIEPRSLAARLNQRQLPGVRFVPIRFTPTSSKYASKRCGGINIVVVDRAKLRPVQLGIEIACTLRAMYPTTWETKRLNRLLINQEAFEAIVSGQDARSIEQLYRSDLESFLKRRANYLLYRE